jgi:hypothetical protein
MLAKRLRGLEKWWEVERDIVRTQGVTERVPALALAFLGAWRTQVDRQPVQYCAPRWLDLFDEWQARAWAAYEADRADAVLPTLVPVVRLSPAADVSLTLYAVTS